MTRGMVRQGSSGGSCLVYVPVFLHQNGVEYFATKTAVFRCDHFTNLS